MEKGNRVRYTGGIQRELFNKLGTVLSNTSDQCRVVFDCFDYTGCSYKSHNCYRTNLEIVPMPAKPVADKPALPLDSAERKRWPMFSGLLQYFPAALAHVSNHSFIGNEKHNPGLALQHARGKSGDHEDCIVRHLVDSAEHPAGSAAKIDELRALAWRALALLQEQCELAGHRPAPAASFTKDTNAST
jgi:hypothetical protein